MINYPPLVLEARYPVGFPYEFKYGMVWYYKVQNAKIRRSLESFGGARTEQVFDL